jgi:asparagine synthase (glutamine-hydrolysing)
MTASVRRQMMSDVPLGAFLSGGVDSNIIVGLMAAESTAAGQDIHGPLRRARARTTMMNAVEARRIAERFGTEHYELPIDLSHPEEMLDLVEYFDQPFGNTTFYLTWLLSRYTRDHVTVALSGAGGDELFGGYPRYRAVQAMRWLRLAAAGDRSGARELLTLLRPLRDRFGDRRLHRVRALLGRARPGPGNAVPEVGLLSRRATARRRCCVRASDPPARLGPDSGQRDLRHLSGQSWDDGNRFSYLDVETFLPDNLLDLFRPYEHGLVTRTASSVSRSGIWLNSPFRSDSIER